MSKLYKCAKNCGSIEEMQDSRIPVCCGLEMIEVKEEEELFGCPVCAGCDGCSKANKDN